LRITNSLLAGALTLLCVSGARVVAQAAKPIGEIPCVLKVSSGTEVLTPTRKVFVAHSEFGDPLRNCVGLMVKTGTATLTITTEDGSPRTLEFSSKETVSAAMLQTTAQRPGFAKNLQVFWSIVTGSTGEAIGGSRGSETAAAALTEYLSGTVLFAPEGSSVDLSAITEGKVESFTVTTKNSVRTVAGVTFSNGILRFAPASLEADRTYPWTASVEGKAVVGELSVLSLQETAQSQERTSLSALGFTAKSPQYLVQRVVRLSELGLKVDSLIAAQEWIRSR